MSHEKNRLCIQTLRLTGAEKTFFANKQLAQNKKKRIFILSDTFALIVIVLTKFNCCMKLNEINTILIDENLL